MKGIVLAGGNGTRLFPLTKVTNKHLLPIYDKPMLYYPLQTLINAEIDEIHIVSGKGHTGHILELLGDGSQFNIQLSYSVQEQPKGIAHALGLCKMFADDENVAVILGDNIFEDKFTFNDFREGAKVFLKRVPIVQAQRFGVARLDEKDENKQYNKPKIAEIVEKPINPPSNLAVTGLYLYDTDVFSVIDCLKPSDRGELEISDVNDWYVKQKKMDYQIIDNFWSDAGTFESLYRSSSFIRSKIDSNKIYDKGDV